MARDAPDDERSDVVAVGVLTVTYEEYAAIDAINWSSLVHLATSAKLLRWRTEHPRQDTAALRRGRHVHCALFEPERWASSFVVQPDFGDGRTKVAKEARAAWTADLRPGTEVIESDERDQADRIVDAIRSHPAASELLRTGRHEEVVTWTDPETGLACKGRLDFISPSYVLDLKTTRGETVERIEREIAHYLYHGQLAFYRGGAVASRLISADADGPFIIAAQSVEPYDVVVGRLAHEDIERGGVLVRSLLERYAACRDANWWPGLAPEVITFRLPGWAAGTTEENDW